MEKAERRAAYVNWPVVYEGLDAAGLDALIAFSPEGTFYLSGCFNQAQLYVRDRLGMVLVPREGEPTYIVGDIEEPLAKSVGWIDDVRIYVEHATSPLAALADVLAEKGLERSRLGIENRFLTIAYHRELAERLPGATLLSSDAILARARSLKMPAEIERIQHAVVTADQAVYAAWQRCHPGDTEKQVQAKMIEEMANRGADRFHMSMGSGASVNITHHSPSDRRLEPGDLFTCVFVGFWDHYWSDNERMATVGRPPTPQQRERYNTVRDVLNQTIELMKPGVEVCELFDYPHAAFKRHGDTFNRPHMGHSMPRSRGHEDPIIQPNERTPLEPNMLFMLEQSYRADSERYTLSHLVQVTEDGHRVLDDWWDLEEMFVFA